MAGTFWCLTLFLPHLQITKLVSPVSLGKGKNANRSHIQAVATWTPQKVPGLWVLPQAEQAAGRHPPYCLTHFYFFFLSKFRIQIQKAWTFPDLCATHCCITPLPPSNGELVTRLCFRTICHRNFGAKEYWRTWPKHLRLTTQRHDCLS